MNFPDSKEPRTKRNKRCFKYFNMYSLFYAAELSGIGYAPQTGAKVLLFSDIRKFISFFLGLLSVVSRSLVGRIYEIM